MSTENVATTVSLVCAACQERRLLGKPALSLAKAECGQVQVKLALAAAQELDYRGTVRSSIIYDLIETAQQVGAVSVGVEAETLNFCCNIVKHTAAQELQAVCKICHHGRMTLVAETEVYDENDELLATALTTLFVVAAIKEIPRIW